MTPDRAVEPLGYYGTGTPALRNQNHPPYRRPRSSKTPPFRPDRRQTPKTPGSNARSTVKTLTTAPENSFFSARREPIALLGLSWWPEFSTWTAPSAPPAGGACASSPRLPMRCRYGTTLQGSVFRRPLRRSLQRAPRLKQSSWATWAKTTPPPITLGPTIKSKSSWTAWISSAPTFSVCSQASFY